MSFEGTIVTECQGWLALCVGGGWGGRVGMDNPFVF